MNFVLYRKDIVLRAVFQLELHVVWEANEG